MPDGMADADPPRLRPHRCEQGDDAPRPPVPLCEFTMSGAEKYPDDPGGWIAWINPADEARVSGEFCAHRRMSGGIARPQFRPRAIAGEAEVEGRAVDQRRLCAEAELARDDVGCGAQGMIAIQCSERNGKLVAAQIVADDDEIVDVVFESVGIKRLSASLANLKII